MKAATFKLIDWSSRAKGPEQAVLGEESVGFNLNYTAYGGLDPDEVIRAGMDYMWCCTMSGGAQMDLRMECDWSDPYVLGGGKARLADRTMPNVIGVHFYDEPGLTWHTHPVTGEGTPHMIPSQVRSFVSAFDTEPLDYYKVDANNPEHVRRWRHWARWKWPGRGISPSPAGICRRGTATRRPIASGWSSIFRSRPTSRG